MTPHLLIALSAHGFGHIGQTAPVLDGLRRRLPALDITVRSAAPAFKIRERFGPDVECQTVALDIGMIQHNALEIRVDETAAAYEAMHADWSMRVREEAHVLSDAKPDLVLANVPYLSLAAAREAGIPAVAMCSLNWADIYRHYFEHRREEAERVIDDILTAYNSALSFLQPEPSIPMQGLSNGIRIGPLAQLGITRRKEVLSRAGASPNDRLVMVSLGGMDMRLPIENWSDLEDVHFIVPGAWDLQGMNISAFEELDMDFADVMASCDALIAKPGYGSFVEAACLGIPVLYLERPNWPEVPYVVNWLKDNGRCELLSQDHFESGHLQSVLDFLWSHPRPPISPLGVDQAADYLAALLA